ncbi:CD151 antigen-like isoform X1 [Zophobas morio]|uniref:CD151 antigen-like isoform X1 n=1 Tax=Zophobas morio TaxID=2755281 RepID=UPI0030834522
MGVGATEGGLRRRMPLRRAGGGVATGASGLGGRAMRYYRLWIYTCNTALLAGALAFCGAAARTVLFDFRRSLVPSLTLYQPSFLYAYLALATQGGALQLLGCVAALRLSEKLLNAYWMLLLVLLFGDVVLGAFWAFKFPRICQELRPELRRMYGFQDEYGGGGEMTAMWDRLQEEDSCCGVSGPAEFNNSRWEIPASCCLEPPVANGTKCARTHASGCDERLLAYLKATASVLAILGYCVLAFLKLCFLGILRYEIREMIQKIRILRTEMELTNANGAVPGAIRAESAESERESLLVRPESAALLSSPPTQTKNPNGNNNYEMREYRSHENI